MLAETDDGTLAGIRKEDIDGSDAAVYVGSFVKGKYIRYWVKILANSARLRASLSPRSGLAASVRCYWKRHCHYGKSNLALLQPSWPQHDY